MVKFLPDILPNELPDHAILYVTHCNITISKLFHLNQKLFEFSDIHIIFCNFIFVYLIIILVLHVMFLCLEISIWKLMAVCRMMSLWAVESQSRFLKFLMFFDLFFVLFCLKEKKKEGGDTEKGPGKPSKTIFKSQMRSLGQIQKNTQAFLSACPS